QGFKPDPGNLAVRHYRGASGIVSHGGTVNPSCNRKSRNGNPPPTAGRARALSQPRMSIADERFMRRDKREGLSCLKHVTHTHQWHEIIQPTADFRSRRCGKQVFRKRRNVVPEIHANSDVTGGADFYAAANADERLDLCGSGEKREIAERLVRIFVPRAEIGRASCRKEC